MDTNESSLRVYRISVSPTGNTIYLHLDYQAVHLWQPYYI
jgi:hypothetical protein